MTPAIAEEFAAARGGEAVVAGPPHSMPGWLKRIDHALGLMVAVPAALLVLAEIVLLFSGVVMRYAFHNPLSWGDELAAILFLWLAMTGAATALHRGAHMRMTAIVNRAGKEWGKIWDNVALMSSMLFLGLILAPAWAFISQQWGLVTPALEFNDGWRVAGIMYAVLCMLAMCIVRLLAIGWKQMLGGICMVALAVFALEFSGPLLKDLGNLNLLIFFVGVVGFTVLSGMPIAFSFGLATFSYLSLSTTMPLEIVVSRMDEGMSQLLLLAVPMFVFLGLLIEMTGMAKAMINFLASLLGHVRGGLSYVLVGAMYLISGISGSKAADMAAVAPILFPEMTKRGEKPGELVALLSATGAQTETVPPSIVLITIGSVTGVSISALFTGGLLPGLVLGLALCVLVWWRARKTTPSAARASGREVGSTLLVAIPALALPVVIRVAVVEGVATATEVSTVGIVYAVVAGLLLYRTFNWKRIGPMLVETAALSGAILIIIGTATAMAWSLTQSGFSHNLALFMENLPGGAIGFMAMSIVLFVVLGSVLEGIPAIVLFGPLMFPIAREVGIHEVQYAMVVILSMGLGLFSPPFGVGYYGACAVSKTHPDAGIKPIIGYMVALLIGIIVVAAIPWISIGFL
ncbi:tripartite ATP-independent transporter DctM subunit [Herbaspirillum sp. SJZ130]|nr:tripartite ATP-independent transporter DctM subunit [Herbaspirillum sp. SJZ102]TQK09442.1 tripartite ATP-independent transporter DctM subunit [Herbaspirillum sp. SJZ130]TQK13871.1 tripartite ATP-independent transporter DctM subunit [Herbaspirillum sp. SJZ106]